MIKYRYFDNAATTKPDNECLDFFIKQYTETPYNPSSAYRGGSEAASAITSARNNLAKILNCKANRLFFTSCGTESNNIVTTSLLNKKYREHRGKVMISAIEHPSMLFSAEKLEDFGFDIIKIPVNSAGIVDTEFIRTNLSKDTKLVSVMHVNNETGSIQPIKKIAEIIRNFEKEQLCSIHFHTDAVQSFCKLNVDLKLLDVDSASFSSHKIYAPRGAGLLYCRKDIEPLYKGGGQEQSIRSGTENTAAIAAFAYQAEKLFSKLDNNSSHAAELKEIAVQTLSAEERIINFEKESSGDSFSPYILSISAAPVPAEVMMRVLDYAGFAVSSGSACSANASKKDKYVLKACGVTEKESFSTIRISFSHENTTEETENLCKEIIKQYRLLAKAIR